MLAIEPLESRIAPATLTGNVLTYTDVDGDAVTIVIKAKGALAESNFTFNTPFADTTPQQLQLIDFGGLTAFAKASITASVVQQGGGNGKVNVGRIDAQGLDLGKVIIPGDLGRITAGDSKVTPGLALLDLGSLGAEGIATQAAGGDLESDVIGKVGTLIIAGDVKDAHLNVSGGSKAGIGKISIGGSLLGGAGINSGSIQATGNIGKVMIGGSLEGTNSPSTGQLSSQGSIASVTVGGSLKGGGGEESGGIYADGKIGAVVVTGGLTGGAGDESGQIDSNTALKSAIVGFLKGGSGPDSGAIDSDGNTSFVIVRGDVQGGSGDEAGLIDVDGNLGKLTIEGAIRGGSFGQSGVEVNGNLGTALIQGVVGGDGDLSGTILATGKIVKGKLVGGKIGKLTITNSLTGGGGERSGYVAGLSIGSVDIIQNIAGGGGENSGRIFSGGNLGKLSVGGSVLGNAGPTSATVDVLGVLGSVAITGDLKGGGGPGSGVIFAELGLKTLTIEGSIIAGTNTGSGGVSSNGPIGSLIVNVDITGTAANRVSISGDAKQQGGVAIKNLTVGGNVSFTDILAGYRMGVPFNASAQIGSVLVTGNLTASNIVAGVTDANANGFGNADDLAFAPDNSAKISSIAKIVIGGTVDGTVGGVDHFGFTAQVIKSLMINNAVVTLNGGANNDLLLALPGVTASDFTLNEVA